MEVKGMNGQIEMWRIGIHLTFVISGVLFALMDWIADKRTGFELENERKYIEIEIQKRLDNLN